MRIPNPEPAALTFRAQVLREVAAFEKMIEHVRAKLPPMGKSGPKMGSEVGLLEAIELSADLGRKIATDLARGAGACERRSRDVAAFMDLAYAVKLDFFYDMEMSDDWFPV